MKTPFSLKVGESVLSMEDTAKMVSDLHPRAIAIILLKLADRLEEKALKAGHKGCNDAVQKLRGSASLMWWEDSLGH